MIHNSDPHLEDNLLAAAQALLDSLNNLVGALPGLGDLEHAIKSIQLTIEEMDPKKEVKVGKKEVSVRRRQLAVRETAI